MPGVYSVTQINNYIKNLFQRDFCLQRITVTGEISNCKYHQAGHIYFTLKDEGASISCVMYQSQRAYLTFSLRDGQKVEVSGQISVYEKTGTYQLYARAVRLSGDGVLYERFMRLKSELEEMGMFDPMYKKPIPRICRKIAIVTAPGGAAIRDIVNVSKRRNPYVELVLFPALVQGESAPLSIARAIARADAYGADCMIVGRGGGSIEDLWAFNERIVAEAIFSSGTPVISAVGHETDFTIADFAADFRAPTPSAAAELANFELSAFDSEINGYETFLRGRLLSKLEHEKAVYGKMLSKLREYSPEAELKKLRERTDGFEDAMKRVICSREREMDILEKNTRERLTRDIEHALRRSRENLGFTCKRLDALSPLKKISGGFGYAEHNGKALMSVDDINTGDMLTLTVRDGRLNAVVTGKEKETGTETLNGR